MANQSKPAPLARNQNGRGSSVSSVFAFFGSVVERFGWPGTIVIFLMYIIEKYGTDDQKREIINMYVLGHGLPSFWPIAAVSIVSVLAILAQKRYYEVQLDSVNKRLDEVAAEKSRLQEQLVGKVLRHSDKV